MRLKRLLLLEGGGDGVGCEADGTGLCELGQFWKVQFVVEALTNVQPSFFFWGWGGTVERPCLSRVSV